MTHNMSIGSVARFFVGLTKGLSSEEQEQYAFHHLAPLECNHDFVIKRVGLHTRHTESSLPLTSKIEPEPGTFYYLADLNVIPEGSTIFYVSPGGPLHEFNRLSGGQWVYESTSHDKWCGRYLTWFTNSMH